MSEDTLLREDARAHHRLVGLVLLSMGALGVILGAASIFAGPAARVDGEAMVITALLIGAVGAWQQRVAASAR